MSENPAAPGQPAEHPEATATVEQHGGAPAHAEASAFGLTAPAWISLAMLVVIAVMIWKKVPGAIARALDDKIALIRDQLAEAESLRKEAEALKAEYEARSAQAGAEAATMLERARAEADSIVSKAETDAAALVERRTRMAEDKIAAEERQAIEQLRASAAEAATKAAARLIAERHDDATDAKLVDQAIGEIGR
jgi:F-type H+-transporting ATPase subunit b